MATKKVPEPSEQWVADHKAEFVLASLSIKFAIKEVLLSDIDWTASWQNIGRLGRCVKQDRIDTMAINLLDGERFAMPIVHENKMFEILAGWHRLSAAREAGLVKIRCYVVKGLVRAECVSIAVLTNMREGDGITEKAQLLERAVSMVLEYDMTVPQVAKLLGVVQSTLVTRLRGEETISQAVGAGAKKRVPVSVASSLNRLRNNDKVLVAAVDYLSDLKSPTAEVDSFVRETLKRRTEAQQLAYIEQCAQSTLACKKPGVDSIQKVKLPLRTKFIRALHTLNSIVENKTLADLQIVADSDEHKTLGQDWRKLRGTINNMLR